MPMIKWDELQLRFNLEGFDEVADDAEERGISPEEARLISEASRQALEIFKTGPIPGTGDADNTNWLGDYMRLREMGWPWRVACYIAWAASPKDRRWPRTLEELSKEVLGLRGPRVIYTWRKRHGTIDTVVAMMQAAPLWEHRREIIEAMVAVAKERDYKGFNDRKLALEMLGDYTPKSLMQVGMSAKGVFAELSDAELERMLGEDLTTNNTNKHEFNKEQEFGEEEGEGD
jgi:hypothetical protein